MNVYELKEKLVGLTTKDAEDLAKSNGDHNIRITKEDGEYFGGSMDIDEQRIHVEVENGKVVFAY